MVLPASGLKLENLVEQRVYIYIIVKPKHFECLGSIVSSRFQLNYLFCFEEIRLNDLAAACATVGIK